VTAARAPLVEFDAGYPVVSLTGDGGNPERLALNLALS
jgi:hypothetical protein